MCCKFTNIIPFRSRNNIKNITDVPYTRFSILSRHALDYIHPSRVRFSKINRRPFLPISAQRSAYCFSQLS